VLLGKRSNRPAQGCWFVPGGRILKDERLAEAFTRLIKVELGMDLSISDANFLGVYDHLYPDSIWGEAVSTHYVVTAFQLKLGLQLGDLPNEQHAEYRWFDVAELLDAVDVHEHTKWYFIPDKGYS
jgi:colanic acid biosynthesis protein WcaH